MTQLSQSQRLAAWAAAIRPAEIPADVIEASKLRVLDVIGLAIAGASTPFGRSVIAAAPAIGGPGPCHVFGSEETLSPAAAAFTNGALSQALEYDDTHNESVVHISSPSVSAALALAQAHGCTGLETLAAIAVGSEIACRIGSAAPQQFHRRGFHPTGLFSTFGCAFLAGRLKALDAGQMANAAGIAGSFASGLLQCWVDGTQSKFLHPGWAAQAGIAAASLAAAGATGPAEILEGRFGLFASHLQDPSVAVDFERISGGLGTVWESRNASFKPYPVAHVIHPYIDALLELSRREGIAPDDVEEIVCPVAAYIVPIVCEPLAEKRRPRSDSHGRVSLPYTLAEALVRGRIDRRSYDASSLADPAILALADRIRHEVDPGFPGPEQFKGVVRIRLRSGAVLEAAQEHNRGSRENPMTEAEVIAKFRDNVDGSLQPDRAGALIEACLSLDRAKSIASLVSPTVA